MNKKKKRYLFIGVIVGLALSLGLAGVQAQNIVTSSGVWYRSGSSMLLNPSTLHIGSSSTRIAKIWGTDLDVSGVFTVGGTVSGGLDLDGNDITNAGNIEFNTGGAVRTETTAADTVLLQAYDVDGAAYTTFATLTANDTPTFDLAAATTIGGSAIGDVTASSTTTFTNKTFDANGTGNSITNIDVADLAVGTDGELITWDASGNPATVAVGTSGQILTSNGAGAAPTFQDAAAGGALTQTMRWGASASALTERWLAAWGVHNAASGGSSNDMATQIQAVGAGTINLVTVATSGNQSSDNASLRIDINGVTVKTITVTGAANVVENFTAQAISVSAGDKIEATIDGGASQQPNETVVTAILELD